ncbi:MAG: hypothetical protein RIB84_07945 [Sneathiellaceae bacterium]
MVKVTGSQAFRFSDKATLPSDGVYARDKETGRRFEWKTDNKKDKASASMGPFSFKAEKKSESKFTWTPLSAEFEAAASFSLKVSTKLSVLPAAIQVKWTPALFGKDGRIIAATIAGIGGAIAGAMAVGALAGEGKSSDNLADISAYQGLIAASAALLALQQNMDLKLTLSPSLGVTMHPVMAFKKTAGKDWEAGGIKNKSQLYEMKKNKTDLLVAVGQLRGNASDNDTTVADVSAIANQNNLSGNGNQS